MTKHRPPIVCQVLHGLRVGGAEVLAARLARRLRGQFRFVFVCLDELGTLGEELVHEGFVVEVLERRAGLDWRCPMRLADFFRRQRVDVLHAHQYTPFFYSMAARLLYRRPAVLFTEHGRWFPDYRRPKRVVANRLLLERRDHVVGVGESVRRALIDNEGIPAGRVGMIYNGISLPALANGNDRRLTVRKEIGVEAADLVILQVARLDHLKDHATAIRTIDHVVKRRHGARLVLVGEGPELPKIHAWIKERSLEDNVRLLGLRCDIARLLTAADMFLLTSISEGIPVTLIEAMIAGLPVVSTNVGGVKEVVEDGVTGLLAPSGAHHELAEHVLQLANDPVLRQRLGSAGRARAANVFSEAQMHGKYAQLYAEMAHG